jgi:hypothetical protein
LTRIVGLGAAFLVTLHAAAFGNVTLICRHAGEQMNPCACPHDREQAPEHAVLSSQSCCQLRTVSAEVAPAVVEGRTPSLAKQLLAVWSLPKPLHALPTEGSTTYVVARQQAPPSTPLYLTIRNLLI